MTMNAEDDMMLLNAVPGKWFRVVSVGRERNVRLRLTRYGLFEGDRVRVVRAAPLKGPLLIEVNGREIALSRSVAGQILVEAEACDSP